MTEPRPVPDEMYTHNGTTDDKKEIIRITIHVDMFELVLGIAIIVLLGLAVWIVVS